MRIATINWLLFSGLAAAILTLALFPPIIRQYSPVSASIPPAQKVIIFPIIASGYAMINKGSDHILAVSKPARDWMANGLLKNIYLGLECIPITGNSFIPEPEQVLYLSPDAVFIYSGLPNPLKKTGLPGLIEINVDPQNPIKSREKIWRQMGEVAGKNARVAKLLDKYAARVKAIQMLLPLDTARKMRVAYVHVNNGEWWTTNSNYYIAYKLELAGVQNASKDFKFTAKADLEQLLLLDPDIIMFAANPGDRTTMKEIADRPEFQSLRAVRERRIYKLPEHTNMNELVEDPLLLTWMAELFYPDAMPRQLRDEYKETFQEVYHYSVSDDEIDKVIYLEENRHSAGYERFVR